MSNRAHVPADEGLVELDAAEASSAPMPESAAREGATARPSGIAVRSEDAGAGGAPAEELEASVQHDATPEAPVSGDAPPTAGEPGAVEATGAASRVVVPEASEPPAASAELEVSPEEPLEDPRDVRSSRDTESEREPLTPRAVLDASGRVEAGPVLEAERSEGAAIAEAGPAHDSDIEPAPREPDPNEMTAAELALATSLAEPALDPGWEATFDAAVFDADVARGGEERRPAAEVPAGRTRARRFDAPWVDEVPDPVTPYELRNSETVRIADLPSAEQLRGRVLANRYLAEEIVDHRASGITYRAYHLALDRSVLVRVLPRGLACSDELCREVRRRAALASGLGHPNIGATLDFGVLSDGWPYLVAEHLQGQALASLIGSEGKFVLRRVLHVGKQLASALAAAESAGLVHGLISPDNVFVIEPGSPAEVALLLGFGVSSARGPAPGPPRSGVFGVPFYVSPEQASCKPLDARSDIYSLGVVLYEMMTGGPPFSDGDFAGVLCQHLDDEPVAPSSRLKSAGALAKAMDAIVQRCLRKEPSRRYQSAAELRDDLVRLEEAAARTKRRPMPEVKRPTTTIHSPPPKAEGGAAPEAKVIVHDDSDELENAESGSDPAAAREPVGRRSGPPTPVSGGAVTPRPAPVVTAAAPVRRAPRVSVDQATIKISAVDRARFVQQRPGGLVRAPATEQPGGKSWVSGVLVALRRFFANASGGDDSNG